MTDRTASDFDVLSNNVFYPQRPKKPILERKYFNSNKEYHLACANAEDLYDQAILETKTLRDTYNRKQIEITDDFWQWAYENSGIDHLPQEVKSAARQYAYQEGPDGWFSEIYNKLLDVVDLVLLAYSAGKEA